MRMCGGYIIWGHMYRGVKATTWRCVEVCGGVWRCLEVYGGVWRCMEVLYSRKFSREKTSVNW